MIFQQIVIFKLVYEAETDISAFDSSWYYLLSEY